MKIYCKLCFLIFISLGNKIEARTVKSYLDQAPTRPSVEDNAEEFQSSNQDSDAEKVNNWISRLSDIREPLNHGEKRRINRYSKILQDNARETTINYRLFSDAIRQENLAEPVATNLRASLFIAQVEANRVISNREMRELGRIFRSARDLTQRVRSDLIEAIRQARRSVRWHSVDELENIEQGLIYLQEGCLQDRFRR